jgi:excisionase family DNA binding protein
MASETAPLTFAPPEPEDLPELLTVREVQALLKIGKTFAYGLCDRGELEVFRTGAAIRVSRRSVVDYLRRVRQ